ncbi:MAG: ABC transporter ATP-binding protein [Bacillota bacterium]
MMLTATNITKRFGGLVAVSEVSLTVQQGSITGLIGPNGAGKTTLFNCVAGFYQPDQGQVEFLGRKITSLKPEERAALGLVRTFQIPREFTGMTVMQNMLVAPLDQVGERFPHLFFHGAKIRQQEEANQKKALELLEFLNLSHLAGERAENLSGGQKKLLELGRALMLDPKLLLLDEPMAGVNPTLIRYIVGRLRALRDRGVTLLFIEHNMEVVMELSDHIYVMAEGQSLTDGPPAAVRQDPRVLSAYLGEVEQE